MQVTLHGTLEAGEPVLFLDIPIGAVFIFEQERLDNKIHLWLKISRYGYSFLGEGSTRNMLYKHERNTCKVRLVSYKR